METATEQLVLHKVQVNNYQIREAVLEGKKHIVVPVVMMKEGVHHGSHGPIYHRAEELSKFTEAWNGIPVVIYHPKNEEGQHVSANSPEVLESTTVGRIFHTTYDDGLRAEAWLDVEKLTEISPKTLEDIEKGLQIDVSVGVFTDSDDTEGEWNGETYNSVARNYRPDHLALLPGERGACSWDDGCGIRANQKGGSMEDFIKTFKELNQNGYAVSLITNEEGYSELMQMLQAKLYAMDTDDRYYYLQEVFADYFVYSVHRRGGDQTLYKRGYTIVNGDVDFGDNPPIEVRRKIDYVTMEMVRTNKFNTNNKGGNMSKTDGLCCEAKVDALIANKDTHFTAEDREWMLSLKEDQIEKLSPVVPEKPVVNTAPQVNKDEVITEYRESLKTIEDYTAIMPEAMKAEVDRGVKLYKEHRVALIKGIMDNSGNNFTEEKLNAMDNDILESIFKSVTPADYSGLGEVEVNASGGDDDDILYPTGYKAAKKEED